MGTRVADWKHRLTVGIRSSLAENLRKHFLLLPSLSSSGCSRALPVHTEPRFNMHTFVSTRYLCSRRGTGRIIGNRFRTRVKVGAKSRATLAQMPIHTGVPEYPIIPGRPPLPPKLISVSFVAISILVSFQISIY